MCKINIIIQLHGFKFKGQVSLARIQIMRLYKIISEEWPICIAAYRRRVAHAARRYFKNQIGHLPNGEKLILIIRMCIKKIYFSITIDTYEYIYIFHYSRHGK